jgi:hypothetical protein
VRDRSRDVVGKQPTIEVDRGVESSRSRIECVCESAAARALRSFRSRHGTEHNAVATAASRTFSASRQRWSERSEDAMTS